MGAAMLVAAAGAPDVRAKLAEEGFDVTTDTPDEFRVFIAAEITKWADVIKRSGAHVE